MADGKRGGDHAPEYKHVDDMEWEMGRFKNRTKFLFHPRADRPTEPNAGLIRYEPGASFPLHRHEFAQVWYVLEGELCCGGTTYGPGTFVYMPEPHFEDEMTTKSGCTVVFLQYPGPTTGARPIYDGRMNLTKPESPRSMTSIGEWASTQREREPASLRFLWIVHEFWMMTSRKLDA